MTMESLISKELFNLFLADFKPMNLEYLAKD